MKSKKKKRSAIKKKLRRMKKHAKEHQHGGELNEPKTSK